MASFKAYNGDLFLIPLSRLRSFVPIVREMKNQTDVEETRARGKGRFRSRNWSAAVKWLQIADLFPGPEWRPAEIHSNLKE